MTDTCPSCDRLREAIDEPLLSQGYIPTETIDGNGEELTVTLRKNRQEPGSAFAVKAVLITEVLTAYPGYEVAVTQRPTTSSVAWTLRRKVT